MKRNIKKRLLYLLALVCSVWSCLQFKQYIDPDSIDVSPPVFLSASMVKPSLVEIRFNEEIIVSGDISAPENVTPVAVRTEGSDLSIELSRNTIPGEVIHIGGFVKDSRGNETAFILPVYGFNDRLPGMIINEFTTQGSSSHPDFIEILTETAGNLGGICLYSGIPGSFDWRYIFPGCEVAAGEYLIIHTKQRGDGSEVDEIEDTGASGGIDTGDHSRDFWVEGSPGLSGNNGVIALYTRAEGECIDAVLYSNRTSESDTNYRGFGSTRTMEQADSLAEGGDWAVSEIDIRPEDAVNPEDSTATRSISRSVPYTDTGSKDDWHITPTSGATPGEVNTNEVYK